MVSMTSNFQVPDYKFLHSPHWRDYELLDSGDGSRLERFGQYVLVRPDAEAVWHPSLNDSEWFKADAKFIVSDEKNGGHWVKKSYVPEKWTISYKDINFSIQLSGSKQVGVFPEQAAQWDSASKKIRTAGRPIRVLNLFGYTGLASISAAIAGADVTHVDASRKAISWGMENQQLTGSNSGKIRWLVDDAIKFVNREARRGSVYDSILMDPPKFGRGPKGEVWDFYKWLPTLLESCKTILSEKPLFFLITAYAVKASALTLNHALRDILPAGSGTYEMGETILAEQSGKHLLSTSVYCMWSSTNSD